VAKCSNGGKNSQRVVMPEKEENKNKTNNTSNDYIINSSCTKFSKFRVKIRLTNNILLYYSYIPE